MNFHEQLPLIKKPIVLIGMMGSGKTSIGKRLAAALNVDFYDSDFIIEQQAGKKIPEIFRDEGEAMFRQKEQEVVLSLLTKTSCVIATGGGAVANPDIFSAIKTKAISIWMRADIAEILRRVGKSKNRPLLQTDDPEKTLNDLLRARAPFYEQADITIDTTGGDVRAIVAEIVEKIENHFRHPRRSEGEAETKGGGPA